MSIQARDFAHRAAVEVYGAFMEECIATRVSHDRLGEPAKLATGSIDGRPVRLVTISGKGGWSEDPVKARQWSASDNISLLDHLLSVTRGTLMFYLADAPRPWSSESDLAEIEQLAHAAACIAFLHDIDKDLGLERDGEIAVDAVSERMNRYGIDAFLLHHGLRISPAAMLNYIEEVEGTQAARSPAAADYDRRIAATCRYIELADKLEGIFASRDLDAGSQGLIASLGNPNRWPVLRDRALTQWDKVEIHDHLHVFLLDRFQRSLSATCKDVAGSLPLIEIVHDGRLLCVIPAGTGECDQGAGPRPLPRRSSVRSRLLRQQPLGMQVRRRCGVLGRLPCRHAAQRRLAAIRQPAGSAAPARASHTPKRWTTCSTLRGWRPLGVRSTMAPGPR